MNRRPSSTLIVAAAFVGIFSTIVALGAHGLTARDATRDAARATARLPVVRMEPVVIVGERMHAAEPGRTQIANTRAPTLR